MIFEGDDGELADLVASHLKSRSRLRAALANVESGDWMRLAQHGV